jgi:hypothetical protein
VKSAEFVTLHKWENREMKRKEMGGNTTIQQCQLVSLHLQVCVVCFWHCSLCKDPARIRESSTQSCEHAHLKDRQGEPQWLQTKPLHTINASLVNEKKNEKNQKLARRVFDFIPIGILKARTGMNFVQKVARGLVQGVEVFPRQRLVDDKISWLHERAVRKHGVKRMAEPKANNFNRFCMCWDDNF